MTIIDYSEAEQIAEVFVGRRIVAKDDGSSVLTLDDGTTVKVVANEGGCACSAGDYVVEQLGTFDAIITSARVIETQTEEDYEDGRRYALTVYAGALLTEAAVVVGDDGNGYYGTGFTLEVAKEVTA